MTITIQKIALDGKNSGNSARRWSSERIYGVVIDAFGQYVRASLPRGSIGQVCAIGALGTERLQGEVISVAGDRVVIAVFGELRGVSAGMQVEVIKNEALVPGGDALLGHVVDYMGRRLNDPNLGLPQVTKWVSVYQSPPNVMERPPIETPIYTGIKALDGLMTVGLGQRLGVFAPAGTGKSTLLGMIARGCSADVVVCALIGERGREVREFTEKELTPEIQARTVTVVATSDRTGMERVRAGYTAMAMAEYFRDQGKHVVLLFDSLTRFSRGLREVAIAAGEQPARRGFPPSVFAKLPQLVERAGLNSMGSITAFFTVLFEGEEQGDPIAEEAKSLLDGHIILTPELASKGHFPAIDVLRSLSRCMKLVTSPHHQQLATGIRRLIARYNELEFLLRVGEYQAGADFFSDIAIERKGNIAGFLQQRTDLVYQFEDAIKQMAALVEGI